MRWCLFLLLCLPVWQGVAAAIPDPVEELARQQTPTTTDYPGEDAVWLLREMAITVEPSGAFTVQERKVAKILTPQGARLAQWEIPYDSADEVLTVSTARTLLNGQVFPVDSATVTDSAVYPGAAWYDAAKVRRFPLPAAMPGAILDVATTHRHTHPRVPQAFSTRLYLRQGYPIREARYLVRVPADQRLSIRFAGTDAPAVHESVEAGHRVYRWSVQHVPAMTFHEPHLPPTDDLIPTAFITSLSDWAPVAAWYRRITEGKDTITDDLRHLAEARTAGCVTIDAKMAALHKTVREIPYLALEMGELRDVPHDADAVARNHYGDCKDKATLLRALLKAVGIAADYVLVRTTDRGTLDRRQYGADEFNHVILAVRTPDGDRFLDATIADVPADRLPPGVDGADGLIVRGSGELVTLPASTAADNVTDIRVTVAVAEDGRATGTAVLTFHGMHAILQRGILGPLAPERYREALERYLAPRLGPETAIDRVTVDDVRNPERPLVITARFSSPRYLQPAGTQYSGYLPGFAIMPNPYRTTRERRYPFASVMASRVSLDVTIALPATFDVSALPPSQRCVSLLGDFHDEISAADRQIHYTCVLEYRRGSFPPTALDAVRQWSSTLAHEGRNQLQFFLRRQ